MELYRAAPRSPSLSSDIHRYIPGHGTWGKGDAWATHDDSNFKLTLARENLVPVRSINGSPWTWNGALYGTWFSSAKGWDKWADDLIEWVDGNVDYHDLNFIGHSHGGTVFLRAAARGLKMRTLTTVGTPRRHDIEAEKARLNIGFWQHICDANFDKMASLKNPTVRGLGAFMDGTFSTERIFPMADVNYQLQSISHSKILDVPYVHLWKDNGYASNIARGPHQNEGGVVAH